MRVLHTVEPSDDRTNPFVTMMIGSLPDRVESDYFSWGRAFLGHYDVIHFQWPEKLVSADSKSKAAMKRLLMRLVIARARRTRTAIVVTVHNLAAHEGMDKAGGRVLDRLNAATSRWVLLNGSADLPLPAERCVMIPHGHYRSTINNRVFPSPHPETLLYFGLIRRYKNTTLLVQSYTESELPLAGVALRVVGKPYDDVRAREIEDAIAASEVPIESTIEALPEDALHDAIRSAGLVVLPYESMYNSGAVLLALSLDRPVLVPNTSATREMQAEFGADWIVLFDGPLDAGKLASGYREYEAGHATRSPLAMTARDWDRLGERYLEVYEAAVGEVRG